MQSRSLPFPRCHLRCSLPLVLLLAAASAPAADAPPGLQVVNGWYVVGGKLLWGDAQYNGWWGSYRTNITRRMPGVVGPNRTEDLDKLTDAMLEFGYPAFEHNYGLWYDRRRDRHDMQARTDPHVVPPFLELPWARSRKAKAWDGLSKYDLEKYNDWYFRRLREFADLCDRKGTLLLHNFYMQHNLLETQAHYADFPWRPVNCIQKTGMPDRTPAANVFYDVSDPVRRRLHEAYIRKCLDVLGGHHNVIFLSSQEFTGPRSFFNFWMDTILKWERETGKHVHIAANGPKDVLDAVLADPVRGPRVDTIDLRYWWYQPDGKLFAPPGGKQVAGRYASGGDIAKTTPEQIHRQVKEYRRKYPRKGIIHMINASRQQTWAVLMGGGSLLVRYLQYADKNEKRYVAPDGVEPVRVLYDFLRKHLARDLPRARPADIVRPPERNWCLAEEGRTYLVYALAGGKLQLDLTGAKGRFRARWLDPRTGKLTEAAGGPVQGGGSVAFEAPDGNDWALWLKAEKKSPRTSFLDSKTFFQTNTSYDPRIALAVDGVVVHRHADSLPSLTKAIGSWKREGYAVGRMFFADSDAGNVYWKGKWDGKPHPDDVERDASGKVVRCAGVRPYMLPTEGWIQYLEHMAADSIAAGAEAILPEEPLAHVFTGYEKSFQKLWAQRYGRPWEPESASAEARFLTAQLKNELYIKLESRLAALALKTRLPSGEKLPFLLPVHALYSNVAARLVAPLGTSLGVRGVDGYVGQVWTGPVNWALAHYSSPEKTFFQSAYALYDYFAQLTAGSARRLWLLTDPVEDNPRHKWSEFEQWYKHCVVAQLLMPEVTHFEVMPWPDRIFLPGHATGGGTPAPERNRIAILSAVQALQEMPPGPSPKAGVGVALSDTLLWEKAPFPPLDGVYGLLLPLIREGVPVSACILERSGEEAYLARFRAIVLSYEAFKPLDEKTHSHLAAWVRRGGSLLVLGAPDDLGGATFWWRRRGFPSPLHDLLSRFDMTPGDEGDRQIGRGWVLRRTVSPRRFASPEAARKEYLPLVDAALRKSGVEKGLAAPGGFLLRRGDFVVAHATRKARSLSGKLVDVFEPDLPLHDGVRLAVGESGLYRDVTSVLEGKGPPRVLHATHRVMNEQRDAGSLRVLVRGPARTPAVLRIWRAARSAGKITARDAQGKPLKVEWTRDGPTLGIRFPNDPRGATLEIAWK